MSKPSLLIITGSFALPEFYDNIVEAVSAKGYEIRTLHLQSVLPKNGVPREGGPATMYDDASAIAEEVEILADHGKDVILIPHSYGGVPTTESLKGLAKSDREKQGKKGGVIRIAYMTCLVPELGVNAVGIMADVPAEYKLDLKINEQGYMYHTPGPALAAICFSDLPPAEGLAWASKFSQHSAVSFTNELTYAGYKDVPVSYLLCEDDLCVPAGVQKKGIEIVERECGKKVEVTGIRAGHCPTVSQPEKTIEWILKVAGEV